MPAACAPWHATQVHPPPERRRRRQISPIDVLERIVEGQPEPPFTIVAATAAVALVIVAISGTWRIARNVVTIVHEGGHALAAVLTGRRLDGIRLHSDTSGLTLTAGSPTGPGMILTSASGYTAPALLGLLAAVMLAAGYITALLWLSLGMLAAMLIMIRNVFGVVSVVGTGAVIFVVSWFAPADLQAAFAYLFTWFLLIAAARPIVELQGQRSGGRAPHSDADYLARITPLPGIAWVTIFGLIAVGALLGGGRMLLGSPDEWSLPDPGDVSAVSTWFGDEAPG